MRPRAAARSSPWSRRIGLLLVPLLAVAWLGPQLWNRAPIVLPLLLTAICSAAWMLHLRAESLPRAWAALFCLMASAQLASTILHTRPAGWVAVQAFGNAVFVYAMLWVFAMHDREPGLRPLASAALVMSIGILAAPAVVIACAVLSLLLFLDQRKALRNLGDLLLLLFTPVLLCLVAMKVLDMLAWRSTRGAFDVIWATKARLGDGLTEAEGLSHQLSGFCFASGALLSHVWERHSRTCVLALIGLLAFVTTIGRARWMPDPIPATEISVLSYAGAACLIALNPPRSNFARLIVFGFSGMALWLCAYPDSTRFLTDFNIS